MRRFSPANFLFIILILSMTGAPGCGTVKSAYKAGTEGVASMTKKVMPEKKAVLKKRTLVFPIMNNSEISDKKIEEMTDTLVRLLRKDNHLLVVKSEDAIPVDLDLKNPEFGVVVDEGTAAKAEEMGMDVMVTMILNPLDISIIRTGIWPLRKMKREIETSTALNALNVTNGTLYLTNIENRKIKLKEEVWEEDKDNWELDEEILVKDLHNMLEDHVNALMDVLSVNPWSGKIIMSGNDGTYRINGGQDIGIAVNNIFEVFDKGEPVRALSGKEYFLRGRKVGELLIRETLPDRATGVPADDARFEVGQIVRLKR